MDVVEPIMLYEANNKLVARVRVSCIEYGGKNSRNVTLNYNHYVNILAISWIEI